MPAFTRLDLSEGPIFQYFEYDQSVASDTAAFETGIDDRDDHRCIVCGVALRDMLEYCHIIPKDEVETVRHFS
jgi:5-methylcytosine-specific restriction endonuclease McrA